MNAILAIALGGACGAVARYGVNMGAFKVLGSGFPYATLTVNVVGSFIMGLVVASFAQYWQPSEAVKLFLVTGFLGAFTTFSAFSLDAITLYERGAHMQSAAYILSSVILSIGALFLALWFVRSVSA